MSTEVTHEGKLRVLNLFDYQHGFKVLQTAKLSQTAVMVLMPSEETARAPELHARSEQVVYVVEGTLQAYIGEESRRISEGDIVIVEKGVMHRFVNASERRAVAFTVYAPPAYEANAEED